jgi:hypothetical protein
VRLGRATHLVDMADADTRAAYTALGHLGQQIVVSPDQQLTVVRLGKTQDDVLAPMSAQIGRIMALFPVRG